MKVRDIASKYGWNTEKLDSFIRNSGIKTGGFLESTVDDREVSKIVEMYAQKLAADEAKAREKADEEARKTRAEQEKQQTIASILVSSGFNFDGYTIKKYSGYISGDDVIQIDRSKLYDRNGQLLTDALTKIRSQALKELKEAAYDLGCNAVVGVDFDYMTFEPDDRDKGTFDALITRYTTICVTANGNAVIIEKNL